MVDIVVGWPGLVVLVAAMLLALGGDLLRPQRAVVQVADQATAWWRRAGVWLTLVTTLLTATGLGMTLARLATLT